jgi:hypothetical protein
MTTLKKTRKPTTASDFAHMSDEEHKIWKKRKLDEIREDNVDLINDLGISILDFNMKMVFRDEHGNNVVGIFASEFKKENGFYFEIVDRYLNPIDEQRTVYKCPKNSNFADEYPMNEKGSYLVPFEELRVVNQQSVAISGPSAIIDKPIGLKQPFTTQKAPAVIEDAPYSEMTIRDYYAITKNLAVSTKPWLNELIKNTRQ